MAVKVEFLTKNQNEFFKIEIPFDEYFDLERNEKIEINSVPKFSQPYQYLDTKIDDLVLLIFVLEVNDEKRILRQTFWNNGKNVLTERIDMFGEGYREIILSILFDKKNNMYETIRLYAGDNFIVPVYHSLINSDKDGIEIENRFSTDFFVSLIKQGIIR